MQIQQLVGCLTHFFEVTVKKTTLYSSSLLVFFTSCAFSICFNVFNFAPHHFSLCLFSFLSVLIICFCLFVLLYLLLFFLPYFLLSVLPRLQEDPPTGVSGAPSENNIMLWNAVIFGWVMIWTKLLPPLFSVLLWLWCSLSVYYPATPLHHLNISDCTPNCGSEQSGKAGCRDSEVDGGTNWETRLGLELMGKVKGDTFLDLNSKVELCLYSMWCYTYWLYEEKTSRTQANYKPKKTDHHNWI